MTEKLPRIATFRPVVLPDRRRVTMEMVVENLPNIFANVAFSFPDMSPSPPEKPDPDASSPYPDVVLSILNSQRREVASLLIVEHKEPHTSLTLHLRAPNDSEQYIARAEMTYQNNTLDVVEVPFTLQQAD